MGCKLSVTICYNRKLCDGERTDGVWKTAFDFIDEVDKAVKSLAGIPYRHPIYHTRFAVLEEVRWISVKNYNVFYKVFEEDKTVEIRRVLHQLQDSENRLNHSKE